MKQKPSSVSFQVLYMQKTRVPLIHASYLLCENKDQTALVTLPDLRQEVHT